MISVGVLIAGGIGPTQARLFADPLQQACEQFGIDGGIRREAGFLANAAYESTLFVHLEESLYYTDAVRAATLIFRSVFDTNHDRQISASEIDAARPYMRNPQALANRVYANRNGNGDEASGDGWRFRGRGLFQLTGRGGYARAAGRLNEPYLEQPELVAGVPDACYTAGAYWQDNGCNAIADAGDVDGLTRKINGPGMAGAAQRRALYSAFMLALSPSQPPPLRKL